MNDSRFLVLPGPKALSEFRINNLTREVEKWFNKPGLIDKVVTSYTHFVSLKGHLDRNQFHVLRVLLQYDSPLELSDPLETKLEQISSIKDEVDLTLKDKLSDLDKNVFVVRILPRPGTISPWSSKATDIAYTCGLGDRIERIERGLTLLIKTHSEFPLYAHILRGDMLSSVFDRMTQKLYLGDCVPTYEDLFAHNPPKSLVEVDLMSDPNNLLNADKAMGLALDEGERNYLVDAFTKRIGRNPTDVELFMFAQVNSEHCRHKIFNAEWTIDGEKKDLSLFKMIRNTHNKNPQFTVSAYSDNAAVIEGSEGYFFAPDIYTKKWKSEKEIVHILGKVETHNHPTAVSPYPGAATGSGGEIRDESAVGRGSRTKAGLSGFSVSDLNIPELSQPWEKNLGKPNHIASPLDIMIEAPIGSAGFNNEFGRPAISGFFRTLTIEVEKHNGDKEYRGFHKPIMLAGGLGAVRPQLALKDTKISVGAKLVVLGGQSMLIGLGGGAASSVSSGEGSADLDFASVQRGNPEVQRRAQQVIDSCVSLGKVSNPIQSIHDVGAGGLSNALPEVVHDSDLGARIELRSILSLEPSMSPMEIWCNESQERFVLAISPDKLSIFEDICRRERAPFAVVGESTDEERLVVTDSLLEGTPIDLEMSVLFGKPPKMSRAAFTKPLKLKPFDTSKLDLKESIRNVLRLPSVASKNFLITIGDRFVTGLVDREQMVGPWQTPVADVGVTATSLGEKSVTTGEAIAVGEKPTLALISASASAKMCVAESLLNIFAADIPSVDKVKLSANWMAAASHEGEGSKLYEAVQAIGLDLCPTLGISVPVGKDSMSMKMKWDDKEVTAPLSLVVTSFAPVSDTAKTWTPQLERSEESILVHVDLAGGKKALGGSSLAQVFNVVGNEAPTVRSASLLKSFLNALIILHKESIVLAYHDISDGGLITAVIEMCFAGRAGVQLDIQGDDIFGDLFSEELGAVFQIKSTDYKAFVEVFNRCDFSEEHIRILGKPTRSQQICIHYNNKEVYKNSRGELQKLWSLPSYHIQKLRDNPDTSKEEFDNIMDDKDPGINYKLTYDVTDNTSAYQASPKPKVAILREQGVNSQQEMAWCFQQAGFESYDIHMTDILTGRVTLDDFVGIAACGGFSYGDVLGAGAGWAKSVLFNERARNEFARFFKERTDTFAFGACNGCQFLSRISDLIPGTQNWPTFEKNTSEQYEARTVMVKIPETTNSIFLQEMKGSQLPIAVAHGEGRAVFHSPHSLSSFSQQHLHAVQYINNYGEVTKRYPFNPNGSEMALAGISSENGRILAMMPHPERVCRKESNSWYPVDQGRKWGDYGPWIKLFRSARKWVETH